MAAAFVVVIAVTLVHLATGGGPSCAVSAPVPSLPAALRAQGGFDQPLDAGSPRTLEQVAEEAARAVHPDLIGATATAPVAVAAIDTGRPDALVVPLLGNPPGGGGVRIAGLVAFLRDCAGRAYYSAVEDLTALGLAAPSGFPALTRSDAAARLGVASPALVYSDSPFRPVWRDPVSGSTISGT